MNNIFIGFDVGRARERKVGVKSNWKKKVGGRGGKREEGIEAAPEKTTRAAFRSLSAKAVR